MLPLEELFASKLMKQGVEEIPAKKAGCVLKYYHHLLDERNNFPATQRIPEIWRGMLDSGMVPYVDQTEITGSSLPGLDNKETKIYHDLDSIAIGVAVGVHTELLNVCEHTKYALSAKGADFLKNITHNPHWTTPQIIYK